MTNAESDRKVLHRLIPFFWQYRWRVSIALCCLVLAKISSVGMVLLFRELIDSMPSQIDSSNISTMPLIILISYGIVRFSSTLFTELRELIFLKATEGATRRISLEIFRHLYDLSINFHLDRQAGGVTRDIERGNVGVRTLISSSLYGVIPTAIELILILAILGLKLGTAFFATAALILTAHVTFTISVTRWRTKYRRAMNEHDSQAQSHAIDALINYETVKQFNNEIFEEEKYEGFLEKFREAALKSQLTLSLLNIGQQILVTLGMTLTLWKATQGVSQGHMSIGDLVMVNAFMLQLLIPLNTLGITYRTIQQSLIDVGKMFLLLDKKSEVIDPPEAKQLKNNDSSIRFENVSFSYGSSRVVLKNVSFEIPAGKTVAIVGPSGSGKSTLARLLCRFYEVRSGRISIGLSPIHEVTQASVRQSIGIVPQDTVLFNTTVRENIAYGKTGASEDEIFAAAKSANLHEFLSKLPKGYETLVGERGLKLSGGEKQRIAIARAFLKNPPIMILDEATSALDSENERAIQAELLNISSNKTTLVIAHRLSSIVNSHEILVLESGEIVEKGTHEMLLAQNGRYAAMWLLQNQAGKVLQEGE